MGGKRKGAAWRRPFLRALGRTGNVRLAAEAAGVDYTTAYAWRKRDGRFAGAWAAALKRAQASVRTPLDFARDERRPVRAPHDRPSPSPLPSPASERGRKELPLHHASHGPPPRAKLEEEQIVRVSKIHGPQVVRAGEGRWSEAKEKAFFAALFDTGNVRAAARAAGVSTTAIYNRRRTCDSFAEAWEAVLGESKAQLEMNMVGAANRALDSIEPAEGPAMSAREAIAVFSACARKDAAANGGRQRGRMPRIATNEEVRAVLVKSLRAFGERVTKEEAAGDRGGGA